MRIGRNMAWRQLIKEKRRLAAAVAGISFAVILMLVQLGFEQALFKSEALLYDHIECRPDSHQPEVSKRNIDCALHRPPPRPGDRTGDVEWAAPMFVTDACWKNPVDHTERQYLS